MKTNSHKSGFTLIELLVVIAIIASLAALSTAGVSGFLKKSKTKQSQMLAVAIESSINRYHEEYGSFPPPIITETAAAHTIQSDDNGMVMLLAELTGDDTATKNYRKTNFLAIDNVNEAGKNGMIRLNGVPQSVVDVNGQPFTIVFNTDYDPAGLTTPSDHLEGGTTIKTRVIVYNAGLDGKPGNLDDVCTWR